MLTVNLCQFSAPAKHGLLASKGDVISLQHLILKVQYASVCIHFAYQHKADVNNGMIHFRADLSTVCVCAPWLRKASLVQYASKVLAKEDKKQATKSEESSCTAL